MLGGLAINLVRLFELQHLPRSERPDTFKDPLYLAQFFCLPLIGGFMAFAYNESGTKLTPILSINIGVTAPLILKTFALAVPERKGPVD
jgi:hypothetical protein